MTGFLVRRLLQSVVATFGVVTLVFFIVRASGSPLSVLLPINASVDEIERVTVLWGLDAPLYVQYYVYLQNIAVGNFGLSTLQPGVDAMSLALSRLWATLSLGAVAIAWSVTLGVPLGVLSAVYRNTRLDGSIRFGAAIGQAVPAFWLGIMLIWVFAVQLQWLPVSGRGTWRHFVLPAIAMGAFQCTAMLRLTRSSMLDALSQPYILLANSKGLPKRSVVLKHAFKNALSVPLTYFGLTIGVLLTGSIVVETVFSWPGLGRLSVDAVRGRDFSTLQAVVIIMSLIYICASFLVDVFYGVINPQIRATIKLAGKR